MEKQPTEFELEVFIVLEQAKIALSKYNDQGSDYKTILDNIEYVQNKIPKIKFEG